MSRERVRLCVSHGQPWIDTRGPHIPTANVRGAVAVRRERGQSSTAGEGGDKFGVARGIGVGEERVSCTDAGKRRVASSE